MLYLRLIVTQTLKYMQSLFQGEHSPNNVKFPDYYLLRPADTFTNVFQFSQ